jgi:hypothetical protein
MSAGLGVDSWDRPSGPGLCHKAAIAVQRALPHVAHSISDRRRSLPLRATF